VEQAPTQPAPPKSKEKPRQGQTVVRLSETDKKDLLNGGAALFVKAKTESKKLNHAGPITDALEVLVTTKVQNCTVINQKNYVIVVCRDPVHRAATKKDITLLTLKFEDVEYNLVVTNFGDLNEGKPPVWIIQLGILDASDDLALALAHALQNHVNLVSLPKFSLYRVKSGFNFSTTWALILNLCWTGATS
jgi:hypothetical protein